jgi:hypothetical protein
VGWTASKDGPQTSARRSCWPPKKVGSASGHDFADEDKRNLEF